MIAEAHEIRENQTFRQVAINQAKQLQNHTEETVSSILHLTNNAFYPNKNISGR